MHCVGGGGGGGWEGNGGFTWPFCDAGGGGGGGTDRKNCEYGCGGGTDIFWVPFGGGFDMADGACEVGMLAV